MTERQLLADLVETTLTNIDSAYRVEQRLRRETFDASSRQKRIEIMGKRSTYAEVLIDVPSYGRNTSSNKRRNRTTSFRVNVWYGYSDAPDLESSSQAVFDRIVNGDDGLLFTLSETGSQSVDSEFFYIDDPVGTQISEVAMDNEGKELAHYLTFNIDVRQQT